MLVKDCADIQIVSARSSREPASSWLTTRRSHMQLCDLSHIGQDNGLKIVCSVAVTSRVCQRSMSTRQSCDQSISNAAGYLQQHGHCCTLRTQRHTTNCSHLACPSVKCIFNLMSQGSGHINGYCHSTGGHSIFIQKAWIVPKMCLSTGSKLKFCAAELLLIPKTFRATSRHM